MATAAEVINLSEKKSLETIIDLILFFEDEYYDGYNNINAVQKLYKELINLGFLPSEIRNKDVMSDFILIDLKYEFEEENVLDLLTGNLAQIALADTGSSEE